MSDQLRYTFRRITHCNMCGTPVEENRVLGRRLNRPHGRHPRRVIGIATTVVRCRSCGLVYTDPQPVPFDIQDHYGVPPESYWKEDYFQMPEGYFGGEVRRARALLGDRPGLRALDVGAGIGKAMIALELGGFETHGFEPSKPFHERAITRMGIRPERLKQAMIEEVEYEPASFDFVTFGVVLEHVYDPSAAIVKAMGWLRKGGVMHIEVPSSRWLINRFANLYYRLRGTDLVANTSPMHEPYHLYEFDLESFRRHAARHGYSIAFHEQYVCKTFLPSVFDAILKPVMRLTGTGMQLCVWLRKE
ncbi:MAG: class I SAM-dependent methyltransferase [Flavobacteriales bacterium]|nr:class I SAM-dependent methyltransferase [Flavobacteriales bacterium]